MKITTVFVVMVIAVCAVAGFAVYWTHSGVPLWLVTPLFLVKLDANKEDSR